MDDDDRRTERTPTEFTRRLAEKDEDEASAGPGAPETDEPTQGLSPDGRRGPGGPAFRGLGRERPRG